METIGERLGRILDGCGKSRRKVALAIEMSPSHLSDLVNNNKDITKLSIGTFMALCAEVSTTPEFLFYGQGVEMSDARTHHEAQLLELLRQVPPEQHATVIGMVRVAVDGFLKGNTGAA